MSTRLSDLELRHVDPTQLLFQVRHPAFPVEVPAWYQEGDAGGGIALAPWLQGTVLATMHVMAERPAYFARVEVMALYMSDEQVAAEKAESSKGKEVDDSTLSEASEDELQSFVQRVTDDLYPFVRSELYALSSRVQNVRGVMLQPHPRLQSNIGEKGQGEA
ncbi:hypothetical protein [Mycobacterium marinum]|uniref:hypothetical protein n=1 Tax=Mycobacterium marinum TaxID=1781 RepID=UPI003566DDB4